MADVSSALRSWSATASSNNPSGSAVIGSGLDDNLRQIQATVRQYLASQGTNMTSGSTVDLSTADGYYIVITGTTTITAFGTEVAGISYWLKFNAALTLTHNGTSLILPGAANITTAAGDICRVTSEGSGNWRCTLFFHADGTLLARSVTSTALASSAVNNGIVEGRLTLTTATPVTTANVTAATTVFFTPYLGNRIATFDGTNWNLSSFSEKSVSVPATTVTPFDVFIVDGTLALETVNWSSDTARATALVLQDGVYVKNGATTRRYLGTCRTTGSSGQTEDSTSNRFVWNYYNRIEKNLLGTFSADRSTTSTTYAELNSEIRGNLVIGVSEDSVTLSVDGSVTLNSVSYVQTAIAFDGTTAEAGFETITRTDTSTATYGITCLSGKKLGLAIGFHYATLLGANPAAATAKWYSSTSLAGATAKTYLHVGLRT